MSTIFGYDDLVIKEPPRPEFLLTEAIERRLPTLEEQAIERLPALAGVRCTCPARKGFRARNMCGHAGQCPVYVAWAAHVEARQADKPDDQPQDTDPQPDDSGLDAMPRKPGKPLDDPRRTDTRDPRHRRPGPQRQRPQ